MDCLRFLASNQTLSPLAKGINLSYSMRTYSNLVGKFVYSNKGLKIGFYYRNGRVRDD